ncbi:MAG: response regulator [Deltaproteobacteria bacterium]|nr:response regulator [Deltaproteobacteria bacterium]
MHPVNVLVVDDEPLICWALKRRFSGRHMSVHTVGNCGEALGELREKPYGLVLLDIHLPDGNGLDLLKEIKEISPETKVIVISSDGTEQNRQRAFSGGASQFIEKPFNIKDITRVMESSFGEYSEKRKNERYLCHIPLRLEVADPSPPEDPFRLAFTSNVAIDVGTGGLRLYTGYPVKKGQRFKVRMATGDDPLSKFVLPDGVAEVVWVLPQDDGVVAGLRFLAEFLPTGPIPIRTFSPDTGESRS